ncbi:DUF4157 domain-containing protein [Clostridium sp. MD294]|uniref:eCIS core domain-containing protein n=1 Tax=Clostridium sp. MD294 TaxID=97138 RepID=UPI00138EEA78|nr:DUF4157 domain-containing protein [Clostridium sp. MD294]
MFLSQKEYKNTVSQKKETILPQKEYKTPQHYATMPVMIQKKKNDTGIPNDLKQNIENRSGLSMNDVKVHYHSDKPAQLQALAYTQGTNIYIASGQEKHLAHELVHVVQQKQGIVKPTMKINGVSVNNNAILEKEADNGYIRTKNNSGVTTEVTQCMFDSQTLAKNINAPEGTQAHHIIPIEIIKEALQRTEIIDLEEFDKAWNGIALPTYYQNRTRGKRLPEHRGSHSNYTNTVAEYISDENIVNIVLDLDYAKNIANYFREIIQDFDVQNVTHIDDIQKYYTEVGLKAMLDFVKMRSLETKQQNLMQELEEFQEKYPNRRYNEQRFQLTNFEQRELERLYESGAEECLDDQEKDYILSVVGEQYIIRDLYKEKGLGLQIGKRLRGFSN